ncbi:hypothetical protein R3W88_033408 [Solanum pinnatisectum]|uniref:Uncharacterized protein n=1 Tax=Solanum pinnatisectum TaxID=50273 RepID=A0AAV9K121_9SOLN|nr:hypothetical protein R3W88_033408 [Solanum pinnatisectum]
MNLNKGTSQNVQDTDRNGSFQAASVGYNSQLGVIHPAGVRTMHVEANLMQKMKYRQVNQLRNVIQTNATNTEAHLHNVVNEQISRIAEFSKQISNQGHKGKEGQKGQNKDTNQHGGTSRLHQDNSRANMDYQNTFPRISNNYARYDPSLQRNKKVDN